MVDVSIIISTRNRADSLKQTLRSIMDSGAPDASCELLVVDNGSTDHTAQVLGEIWPDPDRARCLLEPRPGKGYAYNQALAVARGSVMLFVDDDLRTPSGWVRQMAGPILQGHTDAVQGGIRITPSLERPWMQKRHRQMLASTEYLNAGDPEGLVGANMAIGRHVFERIPAFDVELGPGALGCCEETLLALQMRQAGFRLSAALDCCVEHCPDATRLDPPAWMGHAVRQGKSEAYVAHHWSYETAKSPTLRHRFGQAYWAARKLGRAVTGRHPSHAELQFVIAHAMAAELARLKGSPRNYEHRGLIKIRGIGAVDSNRPRSLLPSNEM